MSGEDDADVAGAAAALDVAAGAAELDDAAAFVTTWPMPPKLHALDCGPLSP